MKGLKSYAKGLSLMVFLMILIVAASAEHGMVEQIGNGGVDWENGYVHVLGYGLPPQGVYGAQAKLMARGAAKADAYRNAVEVLKGVRVDSQTYVRNYVMQNDEIRTKVEGFVQNARIVGVNQQVDGTVVVTMELPLGGQAGLTTLLRQPDLPIQDEQAPPRDVTPGVTPSPSGKTTHTGVIIDARQLEVKPALYPQVFDPHGYLLYGSTLVEMGRTGFTTLVAYARSLEAAREIPRVGKNPLLLKADRAVEVRQGEKTDLILTTEAAESFRKLDPEVIKRAAVVIVID